MSPPRQEVAGQRFVVVVQTDDVPQPPLQVSEGRRDAAARQGLRQASAAGHRRAERQLRLRRPLPGVRGHEGQAGAEDAAAGGRGEPGVRVLKSSRSGLWSLTSRSCGPPGRRGGGVQRSA